MQDDRCFYWEQQKRVDEREREGGETSAAAAACTGSIKGWLVPRCVRDTTRRSVEVDWTMDRRIKWFGMERPRGSPASLYCTMCDILLSHYLNLSLFFFFFSSRMLSPHFTPQLSQYRTVLSLRRFSFRQTFLKQPRQKRYDSQPSWKKQQRMTLNPRAPYRRFSYLCIRNI